MVEEINDLPATKSQNARKLYTAILGTVKQHPHKYKDFISILQGNTVLNGDLLKVLDKINNEYGEWSIEIVHIHNYYSHEYYLCSIYILTYI